MSKQPQRLSATNAHALGVALTFVVLTVLTEVTLGLALPTGWLHISWG